MCMSPRTSGKSLVRAQTLAIFPTCFAVGGTMIASRQSAVSSKSVVVSSGSCKNCHVVSFLIINLIRVSLMWRLDVHLQPPRRLQNVRLMLS
jgi:hypothetical protein